LTDEFSALVLKMMAKRKEDRPENFHEVLIELRKIKIYKDEKLADDGEGYPGQDVSRPAAPPPAPPAPEEGPEEPQPEPPDTICLECRHKWKRRREDGPIKQCPNCGAARDRLRGLAPAPAAAPKPTPPAPESPPATGPLVNPDDIDIDAL
jgi:hypothetical protein